MKEVKKSGTCDTLGEMRNAYKILVMKSWKEEIACEAQAHGGEYY
jgi:hypothetical protein